MYINNVKPYTNTIFPGIFKVKMRSRSSSYIHRFMLLKSAISEF